MNATSLKLLLWINKGIASFKKQDIEARRKRLIKASARFDVPEGVTVFPFAANGIPCERHVPIRATDKGILIYFHGGAYIAGSPKTHRHLAGLLSLLSGYEVIVPDYSLAPENPFPHALNDALIVYEACQKKYPHAAIVLGGDSAGGGLALAAAIKLTEEQNPPKGLLLFAPWIDLSFSSPVYKRKNFKDPILSLEILRSGARMYSGTENPMNPYISPLFGNLEGLPPVFIQTGSADLLYDESKELETKLKNAKVKVNAQFHRRQPHVFQFFYPILKKGYEAIQDASNFLVNIIGA